MTQRVITLFVCLCFAFIANGQTPESVRADGPISHTPGTLNTTAACAPGQAPFAGTFTHSLGLGSQSNDIMYICFGDTLFFDHASDFDLGGDPMPTTNPGIAYALYECPPTVTGPDLNTIKLTDNCLFTEPVTATVWVAPSTDFNFEGDGFIPNEGGFQNFYNGGDPIEMFFAPITVDDFIPGSPGWEDDGQGGLIGPCIHANVDEAFSIVFLNAIELVDLNDNAGGNGCTGTARLTGGYPEVVTSNYVIDIFLTSDPTVKGHSANDTNTTHDEDFTFDVPVPGDYTIEVTDPIGCTSSFFVTMGSCQPVTLEMGDSTAAPGSTFCMPVTVQDYVDITSMNLTIGWDPTVMTYNGIIPGTVLVDDIFAPDPGTVTDVLTLLIFDAFFMSKTIPDDEIAFEICFDIIGPLGSSTDITFIVNDQTEITGDISVPDSRVGYIFLDGSVLVSDGTLMIDVTTICSSPTAPAEGGFNFSVIGGMPPYNYTYEQLGMPTNNGAGTLLAEGDLAVTMPALPPGDYTITVEDANMLVTTATVTIEQTNTNFGAQPVAMNPTCATNMNGSVILNIAGGIPPYTVIWSNGITNTNVTSPDMISGLPVGNYSATVIDANNCQTGPFATSLIVSAVSVDSLFLQNVACNGTLGSITVGGAGGTGPYNYLWNDGNTDESRSGLSPGTYCVTVSDVNSCPDAKCFDILTPAEPTVIISIVTPVECPNDLTGELTANITPGNADVPDSGILWSTGDSGPTITGLGPDNYIVTITDLGGCQVIDSILLDAPALIAVAPDPMIPTCPGDNGLISLSITGGTGGMGPYSITWDDGSSGNPRVALPCDSTYFVTITGPNGCDTLKEAIFLDCPTPINIVFSDQMGVSCFNGSCDGEAMVRASGGTIGDNIYNYQWANGESDFGTVNSMATQLCKGWNVLSIDDSVNGENGCSTTDSVFIDSPSEITIPFENIDIEDASCQGDSDGMITIAASGGTPGYEYIWGDGTTGPTFAGLPAGIYPVTITDANFCEEVNNIEVQEPALFEILLDSMELQQVICPGDSTGAIVVFAMGGNSGIGLVDYQWTDDVSTSSVGVNLKAGTYSITGTDVKGCTDDILVTLEEPDPIEFDIAEIVPPACFGFQTVVTIDTAFGGNGPLFQFSVNNGPRVPIQGVGRVSGGQTALITVFDREGCRAEEEIFIEQPAEVFVELSDNVNGDMDDNNIIEIQLGESTEIPNIIQTDLAIPIDSIIWSPLTDLVCEDTAFCVDVMVAPLESQIYTLTVFDENGCSGSDEILVEVDKNRNVYIPNAFSPNGDGENDLFKPFIGPGVENISFMRVFDRWGELLYSRDNGPSTPYLPTDFDLSGWDGTLNGKRMNPGVYVYIMQVQFVDGQVRLYRGDVTLLY